jgi:hypothetical protein
MLLRESLWDDTANAHQNSMSITHCYTLNEDTQGRQLAPVPGANWHRTGNVVISPKEGA